MGHGVRLCFSIHPVHLVGMGLRRSHSYTDTDRARILQGIIGPMHGTNRCDSKLVAKENRRLSSDPETAAWKLANG
jgi:hypothetical protein